MKRIGMKNRMKFGKDEEAVSPVIGVILMVAITVILAAVIAAFVFGMGTELKTAPKAQLSAKVINNGGSAGNDSILILHKGGDQLSKGDLKLIAAYTNGTQIGYNQSAWGTGTFSVGDQVTLYSVRDFGTGKDLGDAGSSVVLQVVHVPTNSFLLDTQVQITS